MKQKNPGSPNLTTEQTLKTQDPQDLMTKQPVRRHVWRGTSGRESIEGSNITVKQNIKASINIVTFQAVFAYPKTSDVAED